MNPSSLVPDLKSKIPTGSWSLYYHNPADTKWTPDSYHKVATVETWDQFFTVMNSLEEVSCQYGMLFWMKGTIPPLYENHINIRGGCYSIRIHRQKSARYFMMYTIGCMLGGVVENSENAIHGVSISPKRVQEKNQTFNVIKVWNRDCTKFCNGAELVKLDGIQAHSEIIYTPHVSKKL